MKESFSHLDRYRRTSGAFASSPGNRWGAFQIPYKIQKLPIGHYLIVISSPPREEMLDIPEAEGWEHVSVHGVYIDNIGPNSEEVYETLFTPSWEHMCFIKNLFFRTDETVIQFHPAQSEYINKHPHTLHLWKPPTEVQLPPKILV